jgi:hypothetical protein
MKNKINKGGRRTLNANPNTTHQHMTTARSPAGPEKKQARAQRKARTASQKQPFFQEII